jgi:hypothetical protein
LVTKTGGASALGWARASLPEEEMERLMRDMDATMAAISTIRANSRLETIAYLRDKVAFGAHVTILAAFESIAKLHEVAAERAHRTTASFVVTPSESCPFERGDTESTSGSKWTLHEGGG